MISSVRFDSATFDEPNHLARGFDYLRGECRLSPQHPPLFELLFALSAAFMAHPYFPTETIYLIQPGLDDARAQGDLFLFSAGNDADRILFWSRVPVIILSTTVGAIIYFFALRTFEPTTALIATFLYAASPTVLAHSRYDTTDLAATFGFLAALLSYIAFLRRPSWAGMVLAGIGLGVALLAKFSTVSLVLLYPILLLESLVAAMRDGLSHHVRKAAVLTGGSIAVGVVGTLVVWLVYACLMINYPIDEQLLRTGLLLRQYHCSARLARLILRVSSTPFIRAMGQYLLGIAIVHDHVANGQRYSVYFMGTIAKHASHWYFPILYVLKEPLPLHLLTAIALCAALVSARRILAGPHEPFADWMRRHFVEIALATFVLMYWLIAVRSNLTMGVRHLLPTFPMIYILVARRLAVWVGSERPALALRLNARVLGRGTAMTLREMLIAGGLAWLTAESLLAYPHYLSYYNELAGGSTNGHWYAAESNYDWGQDYRRLQRFVSERRIERIAVDGFETSSLQYCLDGAYTPWLSWWGPPHGWFAISISRLDRAWARSGTRKARGAGAYPWLRGVVPSGRIGYSILLYKFP